MGKSIFKRALLVMCCVAYAQHASARPEDYTLDLVLPEQVIPEVYRSHEEAVTLGTDPWTAFLSTIPGFSQIHWGIALQGLNPFAENLSDPMVPASVQKIITAASAFRNLGSNARYENYFEANYDAATTIASDVKFTVSGDPTWGHSEYEGFGDRIAKVISELQAKGITQVNGDVAIVSTRPELDTLSRPSGWPIRWTNRCMATMPSTFMMNGNCGSIKVTTPTTAVWTTPGVDLPIHLNIVSGATNNLTITVEQDSLLRITAYTISGTFNSVTSFFHDPLQSAADVYDSFPVYFGTRWLKNLFIQALAANQIAYSPNGLSVMTPTPVPVVITPPVVSTSPTPQDPSSPLQPADPDSPVVQAPVTTSAMMVDLSSAPLKSILQTAVSKSINAVLDRTYFETAHVLNLNDPSVASIGILRDLVQDENLMTGIQTFDGSGLVVDDRLRADTVYSFLSHIKGESYFSDFLSVLAVSGIAGTLVNRLTGPLTKGNVFAKTGTINNYYNLVGYFRTDAQTLEPFAVFTRSNQTASSVQVKIDQIVTEFAKLNSPLMQSNTH
jgi:D-alanyl-D-alanine carboxypeptidase